MLFCHPGQLETRVNHLMTLHTDDSLCATITEAACSLICLVSGTMETKWGTLPLPGSLLSMQKLLRQMLYNTLRVERVCTTGVQGGKKRPRGWGEEPRTKQVDNLLVILSYPFMEHPTVDKVPMWTQWSLIIPILQRKKPRVTALQII